MDVIDFISKAGFKILSLSLAYDEQFNQDGSSCLWKDIYILCEAVDIVNSDFATEECINKIMTNLDAKYSLSALEAPADGGIGEMTIDPSGDCNVFTIYE